MGTAPASRRNATAADLAALPGDPYAEVIGGLIVEKASPSAEHGAAQAALTAMVWQRFSRGRGPDGWWILTEVEVELESHDIYRPDVVGWRRDRVPTRPAGRPVRIRPDWVCEVLSASNADNDLVTKFRGYHRNGVPHYWLLDPDSRTLMVYRWSEVGYIAVLTAKRDEKVRAEPFEAMELDVGSLFDDVA